ncbi:MAG TPA: DHH family phosphoesterase, partial [Solirubrobacteraceae bacterium]|nr:DHH family phosphoesterase [Solirubrobacteraceae bacterium]
MSASRVPAARLKIGPCPTAAVRRLEQELGIGPVLAEVLVRRGLDDLEQARRWLAADVRHPASAFTGLDSAVASILGHVRRGSRITVHGDYDVDGVCSTAILLAALRRLGADADWYLPSRTQDGYGLNMATVARLAERGTQLLITA